MIKFIRSIKMENARDRIKNNMYEQEYCLRHYKQNIDDFGTLIKIRFATEKEEKYFSEQIWDTPDIIFDNDLYVMEINEFKIYYTHCIYTNMLVIVDDVVVIKNAIIKHDIPEIMVERLIEESKRLKEDQKEIELLMKHIESNKQIKHRKEQEKLIKFYGGK